MGNYLIYNIKYDCKDLRGLPSTIKCSIKNIDSDDLYEQLSTCISDETGFCHYGFEYKVV